MKTESEPKWVTELRRLEGKIPDALRAEIVAKREAAVAHLIELVDECADDDDSWARTHAVELLVALGAPAAAVPALVRLLARVAAQTATRDALVDHLPAFGPPVIEPTLAVLAIGHDRDPYLLTTTCRILARAGAKDERIYAYLCKLNRVNDLGAAECFGSYGDRRALPLLEETIASHKVDRKHPEQLLEMYIAVDAHEQLGGTLPEPLRARVRELTSKWKDEVIAVAKKSGEPVRGVQKRSEPCRCGSGAKYDACCRGRLHERGGGPDWKHVAEHLHWPSSSWRVAAKLKLISGGNEGT